MALVFCSCLEISQSQLGSAGQVAKEGGGLLAVPGHGQRHQDTDLPQKNLNFQLDSIIGHLVHLSRARLLPIQCDLTTPPSKAFQHLQIQALTVKHVFARKKFTNVTFSL